MKDEGWKMKDEGWKMKDEGGEMKEEEWGMRDMITTKELALGAPRPL